MASSSLNLLLSSQASGWVEVERKNKKIIPRLPWNLCLLFLAFFVRWFVFVSCQCALCISNLNRSHPHNPKQTEYSQFLDGDHKKSIHPRFPNECRSVCLPFSTAAQGSQRNPFPIWSRIHGAVWLWGATFDQICFTGIVFHFSWVWNSIKRYVFLVKLYFLQFSF